MKFVGVIPARYASTRFPGKPLADICGYPMVYWVYKQAMQVESLTDIFVATDDSRISDVCESLGIKYCITSEDAPNHIHRIWEVSEKVDADYYVSINGDEPLIDPVSIQKVLPKELISDKAYFCSAYREIEDPAEVIDISNVKIVLGMKGQCLYQSRLPIPSTKGSLLFKYKKAIGIECFNKKALDFFSHTEMGTLEKIEDIDHLRFLENNVPIYYTKVDSDSISVDTKNDLEKVRLMMEQRLNNKKER